MGAIEGGSRRMNLVSQFEQEINARHAEQDAEMAKTEEMVTARLDAIQKDTQRQIQGAIATAADPNLRREGEAFWRAHGKKNGAEFDRNRF